MQVRFLSHLNGIGEKEEMEGKRSESDLIGRTKEYFKETIAETKKVTWPDRKYLMAATAIILVIVLISSIYVMAIDFGFAKIFEALTLIFKPGM